MQCAILRLRCVSENGGRVDWLCVVLTGCCLCRQGIMNDVVMQSILQQAQSNPQALQDHMKNPTVRTKIMKLINAGIIRTR